MEERDSKANEGVVDMITASIIKRAKNVSDVQYHSYSCTAADTRCLDVDRSTQTGTQREKPSRKLG